MNQVIKDNLIKKEKTDTFDYIFSSHKFIKTNQYSDKGWKNSFSLNKKEYIMEYFYRFTGQCAGFSFLWLLCMISSKNKVNYYNFLHKHKEVNRLSKDKEEIDTYKDLLKINIEWFYSSIENIKEAIIKSNHIGNSIVDKFTITYETKKSNYSFIYLVKLFQNIAGDSIITNRLIILDQKNKTFDFSKLMNEISILKSKFLCCFLGTESHAMALYIQTIGNDLIFYFYDPDTNPINYYFSISKKNANWRDAASKKLNETIANTFYFISANYFSRSSPDSNFIVLSIFNNEDFLANPQQDDDKIKFMTSQNYCDIICQKKIIKILNQFIVVDNILAIKFLLRKYPNLDINEYNKSGYTLFYKSCAEKSIYAFKTILKHPRLEPNKKNSFNKKATIHMAVLIDNPEFLIEIIKLDSLNINLKDDMSDSPLHIAIKKNKIEFVKILLTNKNIDLNNENSEKETALQIAKKLNLYKICELLESHSLTYTTIKELPLMPVTAKLSPQTIILEPARIISAIKTSNTSLYSNLNNKILIDRLDLFLKKYKEEMDKTYPISIETMNPEVLSKYSRKKLGNELVIYSKTNNITKEHFIQICCKVGLALFIKKEHESNFTKLKTLPIVKKMIKKEETDDVLSAAHKFATKRIAPKHLTEYLYLLITEIR